MKNQTILIQTIILVFFAIGCEDNTNSPSPEIKDGFSLVINDSVVYNSNHIDFYDFSSQLIYLKTGNTYSYSKNGDFKVFIDQQEVYSGQMYPAYSSHFPADLFIRSGLTFYSDYIIPIEFMPYVDSQDVAGDDPRYDTRIIETLKKYGQYKKGISCEMKLVEKLADNAVKITLQVTNMGTDKLLILDPEKMGPGLFHYYTTGLNVRDSENNFYTHKTSIVHPEPWDLWESSWLTELKVNETRTISITYNDFDELPTGQFSARFKYPGLSSQVEQYDLQQENGRIWLGTIEATKTIDIE